MSAWHLAHASLPEIIVAELEEGSFTAFCGAPAAAPEHRSTDKRILLKAIHFDFIPANEVAEFVTTTLYRLYTASTGWHSGTGLAIILV